MFFRTVMGTTPKGRFNWIDIKLAEGQNLLGPKEGKEVIKIFDKEGYTQKITSLKLKA